MPQPMHHFTQGIFARHGVEIGALAAELPQKIARLLPGKILAVADPHTYGAIGAVLSGLPLFEFEAPPKANRENVERIRIAARGSRAEALVAVGSGTINDLVKYAAFLEGKPYLAVATAPSMNGYVSANASISEGGYKHTVSARAPVAVLADIPILVQAPEALIRAGIGDFICRSTVQADWLLSHLLLDTPYKPEYFDWSREQEKAILASLRPEALSPKTLRDDGFIRTLFEALIFSGLAMRDHGSSAPASQGEHMIAHCREMMFPQLPSHFHGLEIAVTSLAMARLQESVLRKEAAPRIAFGQPADCLPTALCEEAETQYRRKLPDAEKVEELNAKLRDQWPEIRRHIEAVRVPATVLEEALAAAGCPTAPSQLGWPEREYAQAAQAARFTRDRFTFLDLCAV